MKIKRFLVSAMAALTVMSGWADWPFRNHRYDSFKATPTQEGQIVFVGNSITNMHSWFEAFGSHQEVIGRGNSGGLTTEVIANLESYIDSKPSKLFLMIGTNDISTGVSAEVNANRVIALVKRIRVESPETAIYIETILPRSNNAKPAYEDNNTILKNWVAGLNDPKVQIINLSQVCAGINGNGTWTHDGLHPRPIGYAAWCHEIADEVGYATVYPQASAITTQNSATLSGSSAARVEQFPFFPVSEGDVLFFGDEQVHGGEWHELLRSDKIKDRGQLWGWGGMNLSQAKQVVKSALENQAVKPAKIFLFYGVGEKDATKYAAVVDEAKAQAPDAKIYLVSLTPSANVDINAANANFNTQIQSVATNKSCTYVDIFTPLSQSVGSNIMGTNYISGRGYVVMANKLAEYLTEENVSPVTLDEYQTVYNRRNARTIIGNAIQNLMYVEFGDAVGQIKAAHKPAFDQAIAVAVEALNNPDITTASANAAVEALNATVNTLRLDVNLPVASTDENVVWYNLTSSRGNRSICSVDGALKGEAAAPLLTDGGDVWKFVLRGDDTYDIINAKGEYISPVAAYNTQVSTTTERPAIGFSLSYSNAAPGAYVIYAGEGNAAVQLNQTNDVYEYKVFNWYNSSSFPDRGDEGCAYLLSDFGGTIVDAEQLVNRGGWYKVNLVSDNSQIVNRATPGRQDETGLSYALAYSTQNVDGPTGWIYINYDGTNRQVQGLDGFYVGENSELARNPYNVVMTPQADGSYRVQYWLHFPAIAGGILGRASRANNPHKFTRISDETLAEYDIWTVEIIGNVASEPINDIKVTYSNVNNMGIETVYNRGTFFVTPGTEITTADLTVTAPAGVAQDSDTPVINIDSENKIIRVCYAEVPEPVLTVLDKTFDGATAPYRVPEQLAKPVLEASVATTAAFQVTINSNPSEFAVFGGATNTQSDNAFYTFGLIKDGRVGVRYIGNQGTEGWYTRAHNGGQSNVKIVIVNDPAVGYKYYVNGALVNNGTIAASALGAYGFKHFGNVTDADALYIGGIVTASDQNKYVLNGTIHSARFWDTALTATHVSNLSWVGLTATEDPEQSSISDIETVPAAPAAIYDLQGRRVAAPSRGIYIVNGKKVIF